jgi:hypothetical protein
MVFLKKRSLTGHSTEILSKWSCACFADFAKFVGRGAPTRKDDIPATLACKSKDNILPGESLSVLLSNIRKGGPHVALNSQYLKECVEESW